MRLAVALLAAGLACKPLPVEERGLRVAHLGLRAPIGTFDPVQGGLQYASLGQAPVYETLLRYRDGHRPLELEPLLLARMPEPRAGGESYHFELLRGVRFADDPCFAGGVGRELVADDVIYSLKRMADRSQGPKGWWLFAGRIRGFDAYAERQPVDYDAAVEGLERLGSHTFEIHLVEPYPQLLYVLAMAFTGVVPRECVAHYGDAFARHPVGTGPFVLTDYEPGLRARFARNPRYRAPPRLDGIEMHIYEQDQPLWLKWRVGDLDLIQVPSEFLPSVIDERGELRPAFREDGVGVARYPVVDLVYKGFNLDDPVLGGMGRGKKLRQALSLALDMGEINDAFYNGAALIYDGAIPPGVEGHDAELVSPYRGPQLERARALMAEAGYPNGAGLPPLVIHANRGGNTAEQVEMMRRQLARIGVRLEGRFTSFPELDDALKKKKAQIFSLAWISDYPDAENNLALFYGKNLPPGANHFNYVNPAYDRLYEAARVMSPSPERTALYRQMRDILIEDVPFMGGMARTRYYAWNRRVRPVHPEETSWLWINALEVDPR